MVYKEFIPTGLVKIVTAGAVHFVDIVSGVDCNLIGAKFYKRSVFLECFTYRLILSIRVSPPVHPKRRQRGERVRIWNAGQWREIQWESDVLVEYKSQNP